jgi:hypothetical protein
MSENTQTQFRVEGQPAFETENKENDNSSSSSEGKETNIDQTQSQAGEHNAGVDKKDDDAGFADHPRWKQREDDWTKRFNDQETRHVSELQKLREDMEAKIAGVGKTANEQQAPVTIPPWFGGDEAQWAEFTKWNEGLIGKVKTEAKAEALQEIENKSKAEQDKIDEATNYFNSEVATIESDKTINPNGVKVDRNKLLKFVLDNDLVDSHGRWNYKAGFRLMTGTAPQANNQNVQDRKELANAGITENRTEAKPQPYTSSEDFQKPGNRPW